MVILEAFSHGVSVIATPVGAVPEVITDGHNGILVPPGDDISLARAIERLIADANLRKSLGTAAKDTHSKRFEFERYICRLTDLWRRACASA
jgi:glycosyltransferase involved in cell wall biosynthesis